MVDTAYGLGAAAKADCDEFERRIDAIFAEAERLAGINMDAAIAKAMAIATAATAETAAAAKVETEAIFTAVKVRREEIITAARREIEAIRNDAQAGRFV